MPVRCRIETWPVGDTCGRALFAEPDHLAAIVQPGPFMFSPDHICSGITGPGGPVMQAQVVRPDHS